MDQEQYSTYGRHSEALKNLNDLLSDMKARLGSSRNEELMSAIENLESQIQSLHKSVKKEENNYLNKTSMSILKRKDTIPEMDTVKPEENITLCSRKMSGWLRGIVMKSARLMKI